MMIPVVTVTQMRRIEASADAHGVSYAQMMENAGQAAASRAIDMLQGQENARVVVLIGGGNNGGDGLVAARHIAAYKATIQVAVYLVEQREEHDDHFRAVRDSSIFVVHAQDDHDYRVLRNLVASADLVIDAVFGIGLRLPIAGTIARLLRNTNQALSERKNDFLSGHIIFPTMPQKTPQIASPCVLAIDCPSGLNCDTGEVDSNTIIADETITFIAAKPGLLTYPGAAYVGRLSIALIGISPALPEMRESHSYLVTASDLRQMLPERKTDSNKGSFGKVLVIAGSTNYVGAAALAAKAAYRAGAGLVTVGAPSPVINILASQLQEPTWLPLPHDQGVLSEEAAAFIVEIVGQYSSLLLGPGWTQKETTGTLLRKLLDQPAFQENDLPKLPPLIVDADGLNLLSKIDKWWTFLPPGTIITPHPGEMSRLAGISKDEIQRRREEIAREKANEWKVVLLLKGAHTVIASPDGKTYILPFKTDALATAGTGDVLAGTIAGLLAQGMPPIDAAIAGGYIHGLAGEFAAQQNRGGRSVIASDVLSHIPAALGVIENH